jgi:hypothetical protein
LRRAMASRLKSRIERLESRLTPEPGDKLPLAVVRRFDDGSLSPWELTRWSAVIAQIIAAANITGDEERS